jgi:apolipoprotein N-acyltransferase
LHTVWLTLLFGLGMFGTGASWVHVSISQFGSSSQSLAVFLTFLFILGLSICFALPFYIYGRWFNKTSLGLLLAFPAFWVLNEWYRSWLLTGFPWLYVGYAHIDTPLAGWTPIFGVWGVSFIVLLTTSMMLALRLRVIASKKLLAGLAVVALLWILGPILKRHDWTHIDQMPIRVGMAQGNIPQERKWDPLYLDETFRIFNGLSANLWALDWVIWPEAAIPLLFHDATGDLDSLSNQALKTDAAFITGILYDDQKVEKYYNSLVALGNGSGITFKTRLVPFGEYVPMEQWLRGLIAFFNLPTSIISIGPDYKSPLIAKGTKVAATICYEIVYPDLVAERAKQAEVLLTVSNDGWFGNSIGPLQHFQMAQMRALESGRYLVRATNTGVSGIIDPKGQVVVKGAQNAREAIIGTVFKASGNTPYLVLYSWPIILFCFLLLGWIFWRQGKKLDRVISPI